MAKRFVLAVVGAAMGGLTGLLVAFLGVGTPAIILGGILGGVVFSIAAPRVGWPKK